MSATNRAALFAKIHKVLRKHYEPVAPPSERPVLEHLLYACALEHARHESVDDVFARLQKNYFDWNEVRVTSVPELAEVMSNIPDAVEAAKRLKRALQSVFETHYLFDIEFLRKQALAKTVETVSKYNGVTPFVIAYLTQNAFAGHAIPVSGHALALLVILGALSEADAAKHRVPGLERAIPKNKGVEFGSLLHQLSIDFAANPQSAKVKGIVGEIDPDARDRLPKKVSKPVPPPAPPRQPAAGKSGMETRGPKPGAEVPPPSRERVEGTDKGDTKKSRATPAAESKVKATAARITRKKPK
jgi:endonuclease-3